MEKHGVPHSNTELLDTGYASIVDFRPESGTYVAEPVFIGKTGEHVIFLSDLGPDDRNLFEDFSPAQLREYPDVASFLADERPEGDGVGTLNFMGYFQSPETLSGISHKTRKVYRRLQLVAPDLVSELEEEIKDKWSLGELEPQTQEKLWAAYNLMANLVDVRDDYGVTASETDEEPARPVSATFDFDYLKH